MSQSGQQYSKDFKNCIDHIIQAAFKLSLLKGCKVYVLVRNGEELFIYNSTNNGSWPPPDRDLVMQTD
jgi:hypothetical protein